MIYSICIKATVFFILPYFVFSGDNIVFRSFNYDNEWDGLNKHTRSWCKRLRNCVPNNKTVCGWDKDDSYLAEFENICIMYKANCRGAGKFFEVEMIICETKKNYDKEHPDGDELEWIHIVNGTSAASTIAPPPTDAAHKEGLRQRQFQTMYPEGGTLPPNFFDNEEPKKQSKKFHVRIPKSELQNRILELLWRRAAGNASFESDSEDS